MTDETDGLPDNGGVGKMDKKHGSVRISVALLVGLLVNLATFAGTATYMHWRHKDDAADLRNAGENAKVLQGRIDKLERDAQSSGAEFNKCEAQLLAVKAASNEAVSREIQHLESLISTDEAHLGERVNRGTFNGEPFFSVDHQAEQLRVIRLNQNRADLSKMRLQLVCH